MPGEDQGKSLVHVTKILDEPCRIWFIGLSAHSDRFAPTFDWVRLLLEMDESLIPCFFRGTNLSYLGRIMATGIDVEPADEFIFVADSFEKAWEYGDWPKIVLGLDPGKLHPTYVEIPSDTAQQTIDELMQTYPTKLTSLDGSKLWLSKLPPDDGRLAKPYETDFARWIKENPFAALKGVMIFVRPQDQYRASEIVRELVLSQKGDIAELAAVQES